jgi:hypothetical protein
MLPGADLLICRSRAPKLRTKPGPHDGVVSPYVRMVKTESGATAVQVVLVVAARDIEHVGSAHDDAQLEVLKAGAAARRRIVNLSL